MLWNCFPNNLFLPAQGILSMGNCSRFYVVQEMLASLQQTGGWSLTSCLSLLCKHATPCIVFTKNSMCFLEGQTQKGCASNTPLLTGNLGHFCFSLNFSFQLLFSNILSNFAYSFPHFIVVSVLVQLAKVYFSYFF